MISNATGDVGDKLISPSDSPVIASCFTCHPDEMPDFGMTSYHMDDLRNHGAAGISDIKPLQEVAGSEAQRSVK